MTRRTTPKDAVATDAKKATASKRTPAKKQAPKQSKADIVRAQYIKDPSARPVDVAKATGVEAAYVWDVRAAMQRKGMIPTVAKNEQEASK